MGSKQSTCILLVGIVFSTSVVFTEAFGEDLKVTCPGSGCSCKTVSVHECDAKSDGKLYNCHDVSELQCTITSGPGSGKGPIKVKSK
jgi:hypothetical protein